MVLTDATPENQSTFLKADYFASNSVDHGKLLNSIELISLWALRQQICIGACVMQDPTLFEKDPKLRAQWECWKNLKDMDANTAIKAFVEIIEERNDSWMEWSGFPMTEEGEEIAEKHLLNFTTMQTELNQRQLESIVIRQQAMARARLGRAVVANGKEGGLGKDETISAYEDELAKKREEAEEDIKALWRLLQRGVVVRKYRLNGKEPQERVLWMDQDETRLFIGREKRQNTDSSPGQGIWVRDLSDVRRGPKSFVFSTVEVTNPDTVMSIIGSERSIDIELPTKDSRDRMFNSFRMLTRTLATTSSGSARSRFGAAIWAPYSPSVSDINTVATFKRLLQTGVEVFKHTRGGESEPHLRVLYLDQECKRLYISAKQRQAHTGGEKGVSISDISEVRPGLNAFAFEKMSSRVDGSLCLSIIGSERSIDLELPSEAARDTMVWRLRMLVRHCNMPEAVDAVLQKAGGAAEPEFAPAAEGDMDEADKPAPVDTTETEEVKAAEEEEQKR